MGAVEPSRRSVVASILLSALMAGTLAAPAGVSASPGSSPSSQPASQSGPIVAGAPASTSAMAASLDPCTAAVISKYQQQIPQLMADQGVPGLSVALVDGANVLWSQGFGYTDRDDRTPVTTDTIFSVQSMSKMFTATAVMRAVQAGLVDLDVPITTYLPDFTVHSAFEQHPEQKITLRTLLSHTAGFTHEAPVGNNYDLDSGDFDAHVASISDTWLRFPVGTGYAYSNLGIDLAGYILEKVEDKPFAQVMADTVLGPLGMSESTFDRDRIRATADRAIGQNLPLPAPPVDVPMTAAGGLYTSASDLARFLSFQLGDGTIDGANLLDPALMTEMRTVPAPNAGAAYGYALGVARTRWMIGAYPDLFSHGGGGFGFIAQLYFLPQLQLGIAILTNSSTFDADQYPLGLSILRDLVGQACGPYQARMAALPYQGPIIEGDSQYQPPAQMSEDIAAVAMPASADQAARWAGYEGAYRIATWGVISPTDPPDRFFVDSGVPYLDSDEDGSIVRLRLTEFQPGLFIAGNGEVLDFRGPQPTWRNLDLIRVTDGPLPWQWVLLGLVALAAIVWFVGGLVTAVWRRRRRAAEPESQTAESRPRRPHRRWSLLASAVASLAAILALVTIALIVAIPGWVDVGFIGWLDVPMALKLVLHLPLALTILACCLVALAIVSWRQGWWSRASWLRYGALTVAAWLLVGQLALWHLIGWGF